MPTSLRLPPEIEADIKQLAEAHERSEHGEMIYGLKRYIEQEKRAMASKYDRLAVVAKFVEPGFGETSTSTVAFGWEEAQEKAQEMRAWVRREFNAGCVVDIRPDKPDYDRKVFHHL